MRALSIRQPYAELILRGIKTAELRSRGTRIVGERFYIYACKAKATPPILPVPIWSEDLRVAPPGSPPLWMIELAEQVRMIEPELLTTGALLPTGVIVGSAVIEKVSRADSIYRWHLADVERAKKRRRVRATSTRSFRGRRHLE